MQTYQSLLFLSRGSNERMRREKQMVAKVENPPIVKTPTWWKVFVSEYVSNGNVATEAYLRARPSVSRESAHAASARLLADVRFKAYLSEVLKGRDEKADFTIQEYYSRLKGIARFDLAELFERDEVTHETILRKDWIDIAKRHKAMESVQVDTMTLESGGVVQRLKLKPYAATEAIEKLGKLLGYDNTSERVDVTSGGKSLEQNLLNVLQATRTLVSEGKIDPKTIDVETLSQAELED